MLDCLAAIAAVESLNVFCHVAFTALDRSLVVRPEAASAQNVQLEVVAGGPHESEIDAFDAGVGVQSLNHVSDFDSCARELVLVRELDHVVDVFSL